MDVKLAPLEIEAAPQDEGRAGRGLASGPSRAESPCTKVVLPALQFAAQSQNHGSLQGLVAQNAAGKLAPPDFFVSGGGMNYGASCVCLKMKKDAVESAAARAGSGPGRSAKPGPGFRTCPATYAVPASLPGSSVRLTGRFRSKRFPIRLTFTPAFAGENGLVRQLPLGIIQRKFFVAIAQGQLGGRPRQNQKSVWLIVRVPAERELAFNRSPAERFCAGPLFQISSYLPSHPNRRD